MIAPEKVLLHMEYIYNKTREAIRLFDISHIFFLFPSFPFHVKVSVNFVETIHYYISCLKFISNYRLFINLIKFYFTWNFFEAYLTNNCWNSLPQYRHENIFYFIFFPLLNALFHCLKFCDTCILINVLLFKTNMC